MKNGWERSNGCLVVSVLWDLFDGHQPAAAAPVAELGIHHLALHQALLLRLHVTQRDQVAAALRKTEEAFGAVDVLVNNAGYGYMAAVEEGEDDQVRAMFETNYFGVVEMIKATLPLMRTRGSGHIINISSMTGLVANPPNVYYSSTKFALEALTEGLAKEVEHRWRTAGEMRDALIRAVG